MPYPKKKLTYKKTFDPSYQKVEEWERRYYAIKTHARFCEPCRNLLSRWRPRDEYGVHLFYRMAGLQCLYFFDYEILGYKDMLINTHYELCCFTQSWKKNYYKQQYKQIRMPRDSFKSSVVTIGYSVQSIVRNPNIQILINNASAGKARNFIDEIKQHFSDYPGNKLKEHYGKFIPSLKDPKRLWRENMFRVSRCTKLSGAATLAVSGVEASKTSQHYDLIINDDLHDEDNTQTMEQIKKVIRFRKSLAAILKKPDGRQIDIGTRWGDSDVLSEQMESQKDEVELFVRKSHNKDGSLFFPTRLSEAVLSQQLRIHGSHRYSCFFNDEPLSEEDAKFKKEWFKYYVTHPDNLKVVTAIDPASGQGRDNTAIVTIGYDSKEGGIYVLDLRFNNRWNETRVALEIGQAVYTYKPSEVGMEAAALGTRYRNAIQKEFNRLGIRQEVKALKADSGQSKPFRIAGMVPLYEEGAIFHRENDECKHLEEELLWFRMDSQSHVDDCADCLARAIQMIDLQKYKFYDIPRTPRPSWTMNSQKDDDPDFMEFQYGENKSKRLNHNDLVKKSMRFHPRW